MSKRKTHEEFVEDFKVRGNKNVIILGRYVSDKTKILVKCKIDGYEWNVLPYNLLSGCGCPLCSGKVTVVGINDFATSYPHFVKYFDDPIDATKITAHSNKRVALRCPDCGTKKMITANMLCKRGFHCEVCGDNISFPNKFGRSLLRQLPLDYYECEWSPDWLKPCLYDNYFVYNGSEYVLEMDGDVGHGNRQFNSKAKDIDGFLRDQLKDSLAKERQIEVIRIDCRKSEKDYIVNNIMKSNLPNIFNLESVDWDKCERESVQNLVKIVCDEYVRDETSFLAEIAQRHSISRLTVRRYLKKGATFGWCSYCPEQSIKNSLARRCKPVDVFDEENNLIETYDSIKQCALKLSNIYHIKFDNTNITRAIKSGKPYKGLYFKYA